MILFLFLPSSGPSAPPLTSSFFPNPLIMFLLLFHLKPLFPLLHPLLPLLPLTLFPFLISPHILSPISSPLCKPSPSHSFILLHSLPPHFHLIFSFPHPFLFKLLSSEYTFYLSLRYPLLFSPPTLLRNAFFISMEYGMSGMWRMSWYISHLTSAVPPIPGPVYVRHLFWKLNLEIVQWVGLGCGGSYIILSF